MLDSLSIVQRIIDETLLLLRHYSDFWIYFFRHPLKVFYIITIRHKLSSKRLSPNTVSTINIVLIILSVAWYDNELGVNQVLSSAKTTEYVVPLLLFVVFFCLMNYPLLKSVVYLSRIAEIKLYPIGRLATNIYLMPLMIVTSIGVILTIILIAESLFFYSEFQYVAENSYFVLAVIVLYIVLCSYQMTNFARRRVSGLKRGGYALLVTASIAIPLVAAFYLTVTDLEASYSANSPISYERWKCGSLEGRFWVFAVARNETGSPVAIKTIPLSVKKRFVPPPPPVEIPKTAKKKSGSSELKLPKPNMTGPKPKMTGPTAPDQTPVAPLPAPRFIFDYRDAEVANGTSLSESAMNYIVLAPHSTEFIAASTEIGKEDVSCSVRMEVEPGLLLYDPEEPETEYSPS